jgi:hypothetical protein
VSAVDKGPISSVADCARAAVAVKNPKVKRTEQNPLDERIETSFIGFLPVLGREECRFSANGSVFAKSTGGFRNPLKKKHLEARNLAANQDRQNGSPDTFLGAA